MSEEKVTSFCFAIATLKCDAELIASINSILSQNIDCDSYEVSIVFGDQSEESKFSSTYLSHLPNDNLPKFNTDISSGGIYAAFNVCILI